MDATMILIAFVLGFIVKQVGLPPLIGFLAAGFVLNAFGMEGGTNLKEIADAGVILLLFSIGLKVRVKDLLKPEVWAAASIHMTLTVAFMGTFIYLLTYTGLTLLSGIDWRLALLIAFALSFSSTVFTVKVLEEKGEMSSNHGQIAVGILILQDFFAVIFLTLSSGKVPSMWAFALIGLILLRRPILFIMEKSGHGELLILLGLLIPIAGAELFELVKLKPDLGALLIGMLLAGHPKTNEIAKSILSFKDLLLVGFFLTIGLSGLPNISMIGISLLLVLVIPVKVALYFLILSKFKLRARTATLASTSLATYSEFGLIIGALSLSKGWLSSEWLVIFALSLSITFVLASPLNNAAHQLYEQFNDFLKRFQSKERLPEDRLVDTGEAKIVIFGMGRVGAAAYETLFEKHGNKVVGLDFNQKKVEHHSQKGWNVMLGDATDYDFWERVQEIERVDEEKVNVVILAMANFEANLYAAKRIRKMSPAATIAALSSFDDQAEQLKDVGVNFVFNAQKEAGAGFANHVCSQITFPNQV